MGYISVGESFGISSTTFTHCVTKATEFAEITQSNGYYAVQGHSKAGQLFWYCSHTSMDAKHVEIHRGAPNNRTDLSR